MRINLNGLNDEQRQAALHKDGPCRVCAGAGSGKTKVLITRIGNLILNHSIPAKNIFVGTFTKKAAEVMVDRLSQIVPRKDLKELTIGTFHSIAWHILADEYKAMEHPLAKCFAWGNQGLGSDSELRGYIVEAMKTVGMKTVGMKPDAKDGYGANDIRWIISCAKNQLMDADKYAAEAITPQELKVAEIYKLYENRKDQEVKIDFDDMLLKLFKLFVDHKSILRKYQSMYRYILIDESQDNNYAQFELARMLAAIHGNIMIVGDHNQSIYRFRGATPEEFLDFDKYFENTRTLKLRLNYRSNSAIIHFANKIIAHNPSKIEMEMLPSKEGPLGDNHVRHFIVDNENKEAELVTSSIIGFNLQGTSYKDQAVLFRTGAQIRAVEDQFIKNKIPYVIFGGLGFYELSEVKDLTSFVRLIVDHEDNEALERIINVPSRYLGGAFMKELRAVAKTKNISFWSALKWIKVKPYQHKSVVEFMKIIDGLSKRYISGELKSPKTLIEEIMAVTSYKDTIKEPANKEEKEEKDSLLNINTLLTACDDYKDASDLVEFIRSVDYTNKKDADAVQIMNIHKSKGLEMKKVFSIGWSEGLLPHRFALESNDEEEIQEERRLAYVAATRAEEDLYTYSPQSFNHKSVSISRFIYEGELVTQKSDE